MCCKHCMPSAGGEASPLTGNQVPSSQPTVMVLLARELGTAWSMAIHFDERMAKAIQEGDARARDSFSEECDRQIARARSFENALVEMMPETPADALVSATLLAMLLDSHLKEDEPLTQ